MNTDMTTYDDDVDQRPVRTTVHNPFGENRQPLPAHANVGTISIESARAVAEAQGALVVARANPRDPFSAFQRAMEACRRPGLADQAFYRFRRGGEDVTGPTIRVAEELARIWGNVEYGIRELSNKDGVTELEAFAWDLETNTKSSQRFTVQHVRDTKSGRKELTDQRDIYELGANLGARRLRERIFAILPADLKEAAEIELRRTLANRDRELPLADRVKAMVDYLSRYGVSLALIEQRLGHKVAETTPEELAALKEIATGLRSGESKVSDFFGQPRAAEPAADKPKPDRPAALANARPVAAQAAAAEPHTSSAENAARRDEPVHAPIPAPEAVNPSDDDIPV